MIGLGRQEVADRSAFRPPATGIDVRAAEQWVLAVNRVAIKPQLLRWACAALGVCRADLECRFPRLSAWESGTGQPTLKQVEAFAKATCTPVGYLFLSEPPVETIPIPDFRAPGNTRIGRPSPDLLDTIYVCQQRQEWFRNHARTMGESPLAFVGSANR